MANLFGNALYYGDNLEVMRAHLYDDSVDLVYLDPPFNSNRSYNLLFKNASGEAGSAQIHAFDDTWHWGPEAERAYFDLEHGQSARLAQLVRALRQMMGPSDMLAYLVMMGPRLLELHRLLKPTGSLYLHCDPTSSHYLRLLLDAIFLPTSFRNEIIWRRTGSHGKVRRFGPIHDVILFYTKSETYTWNGPTRPYMRGHVEQYFERDATGWKTAYYGNVLTGSGTRGGESGRVWKGFDPTAKGRHWAVPGKLLVGFEEATADMGQHEKMNFLFDKGFIKIVDGQSWPIYERYLTPEDGTPVGDLWSYQPYTEGTVFGSVDGIDADVRWLSPRDSERLGYPTQKPLALLERIISASSNPGDLVLDPFCGCGTAVDAAQRLGRTWIGIDISHRAIKVVEDRMAAVFGPEIAGTYEKLGIPVDVEGAQALANRDKVEFEIWAVSLVKGQHNPQRSGDRGVDGFASFALGAGLGNGTIVISVKGGANNPGFVRDLIGTVNGHHAEMGLMITLRPPTKGMKETAATAGWFEHPNGQRYPRVQILSVEQLLHDERPNWPPMIRGDSTMGRVTRPAAAARRRAQAG